MFTTCFLLLNALFGGGKRIRTADHLVANQALSQLSYTPKNQSQAPDPKLQFFQLPLETCDLRLFLVGLGRFELPTSRLSGVRSNHLSYRPSPLLMAYSPNPFPLTAEGLPRPSAFFSQN